MGALKDLAQADIENLERAGVSAQTSREAMLFSTLFSVSKGNWRPDADAGRRGYVLPVASFEQTLLDMVAFRLDAPLAFWTAYNGGSPYLGHEALERASFYKEPLRVYETPLEWLQNDCAGIVVLDLRAFWPLHLADIPYLITTNQAFGVMLLAQLERPFSIPDVRFPT